MNENNMQNNEIISNRTTPEANARLAENLAAEIQLNDPALSTTYGADAMRNISRFADTMLEQVRAKDSGHIGESLGELLGQVKDFDPRSIVDVRPSPLAKIPLIGSLFNKRARSVVKFDTLAGQVDAIALKLEDAMTSLLRDIEVLEQLYDLNRDFHNELALYLEAGQLRLNQARETELPALMQAAESSTDSMAAQRVRDFSDQINRFERRLHDLQLSRSIALQTAPQIRLIQSNDQTLAEKIQTSILTTIPIWKSQMVLALSLQAQKGAVELQRNVADTTNALLKSNAEMLQQATIETARQVERSIVDMDTLRETHGKLINTVEETLRIAQEGRNQRRQAEQELAAMEQDLKAKLTALAQTQAKDAIAGARGDAANPTAADGTRLPGEAARLAGTESAGNAGQTTAEAAARAGAEAADAAKAGDATASNNAVADIGRANAATGAADTAAAGRDSSAPNPPDNPGNGNSRTVKPQTVNTANPSE